MKSKIIYEHDGEKTYALIFDVAVHGPNLLYSGSVLLLA
jgi:hypothetical protein